MPTILKQSKESIILPSHTLHIAFNVESFCAGENTPNRIFDSFFQQVRDGTFTGMANITDNKTGRTCPTFEIVLPEKIIKIIDNEGKFYA